MNKRDFEFKTVYGSKNHYKSIQYVNSYVTAIVS